MARTLSENPSPAARDRWIAGRARGIRGGASRYSARVLAGLAVRARVGWGGGGEAAGAEVLARGAGDPGLADLLARKVLVLADGAVRAEACRRGDLADRADRKSVV